MIRIEHHLIVLGVGELLVGKLISLRVGLD